MVRGRVSPDLVESAGAATTADGQRASHRRLFREMIKEDLAAGPATYLRRRAMVRFARRLGIAPDEARLIMRAVEYELQLEDQSPDRFLADMHEQHVKRLENVEAVLRIGVAAMLFVLYYLLVRWLVRLLS